MHVVEQELTLSLEQLFGLFRRAATAGELSLPAASVLGRLVRNGAVRLTDLAQGERVSQPAMTQLVSRLQRDGLVCKRSHDADGRAVLVEVTPAGRRLVQQRRAERAAMLRALLDALSPEDAAAVRAAVGPLQRLADAAHDRPTPIPTSSEVTA